MRTTKRKRIKIGFHFLLVFLLLPYYIFFIWPYKRWLAKNDLGANDYYIKKHTFIFSNFFFPYLIVFLFFFSLPISYSFLLYLLGEEYSLTNIIFYPFLNSPTIFAKYSAEIESLKIINTTWFMYLPAFYIYGLPLFLIITYFVSSFQSKKIKNVILPIIPDDQKININDFFILKEKNWTSILP